MTTINEKEKQYDRSHGQEVGLADIVSDQDHLGWERYFKAIADFIITCRTPMTMAIQGDWGVGKSTAINLIEKEIKGSSEVKKRINSKSKFPIVKFNTWQYSKIEKNTTLFTELICQLARQVAEYDEEGLSQEGEKQSDFLKSITGIAKAVGKVAVDIGTSLAEAQVGSVAQDFKGIVKKAIYDSTQGGQEETLQISQRADLEELKQKLSENISRIVKGGRLIVFVDDLDRLEPKIAIELLEALKIFLDLPDCVFVLAMDKEVVYQGIRSKYGDDFRKDKGVQFFDKIIQVPFDLPVRQFDIDAYMEHLLEEDNYVLPSRDREIKKKMIARYTSAVNYLGERNPRAIKRSMNLLALYKLIFRDELEESSDDLFYVFTYLLYQKNQENNSEDRTGKKESEDLLNINSEEELRSFLPTSPRLCLALGITLQGEVEDETGSSVQETDGSYLADNKDEYEKIYRAFFKIIRLFASISDQVLDESIMSFAELDNHLKNLYGLTQREEETGGNETGKKYVYEKDGNKILKLTRVITHDLDQGSDSYNIVIYAKTGVIDLDRFTQLLRDEYHYEHYRYNKAKGHTYATFILPGTSVVKEVIFDQYVRILCQ